MEVSPTWSTSLLAILRRMRRMILPERVFGSAGAQWITSGAAMGPISLRTWSFSSYAKETFQLPRLIQGVYVFL